MRNINKTRRCRLTFRHSLSDNFAQRGKKLSAFEGATKIIVGWTQILFPLLNVKIFSGAGVGDHQEPKFWRQNFITREIMGMHSYAQQKEIIIVAIFFQARSNVATTWNLVSERGVKGAKSSVDEKLRDIFRHDMALTVNASNECFLFLFFFSITRALRLLLLI